MRVRVRIGVRDKVRDKADLFFLGLPGTCTSWRRDIKVPVF